MLRDLAVLDEMVIEVAKWKFLSENPTRERSPRGFADGVELKLTGLEEGSAKAIISLVVAGAGLFPMGNTIYFEMAKEAIVSAIAAAERNESATAYLPASALSYFDRMGRSLRDGEAMEFPGEDGASPSKLTRESRRKLVLASAAVKEITEDTTIRGLICEADQAKMTFEVLLADGAKITNIPMDAPHLETILKAFSEFKKGTRVQIQGIGRLNRTSRLQGFERVQHIRILDPLDIGSRLDELRNLSDGWLDGKGKAPSTHGIDWLAEFFDRNYADDLPLPYLYPTPEGGVHAEWRLDPLDATLEIDLNSRTASFHALDLDSGREDSRQIDLQDQVQWMWVLGQLRR
jgi:hypothetical protein